MYGPFVQLPGSSSTETPTPIATVGSQVGNDPMSLLSCCLNQSCLPPSKGSTSKPPKAKGIQCSPPFFIFFAYFTFSGDCSALEGCREWRTGKMIIPIRWRTRQEKQTVHWSLWNIAIRHPLWRRATLWIALS